MKIPSRLQPLVDDGLIDVVLQRLKSGKEADVYTVLCGDNIQCAKVYKEAMQRSFKQAVQYQEGRKFRNTRNARAMQKNSKFGRKQQEESWQTAEVDALFRLANAGVRVPQPYICIGGVLLMELVTDGEGAVAPRLSDVALTEESAIADFDTMIRNIVRMLCAGIVHGDLSEFNVLLDAQGPVIIDLPQAVDAAANNLAESMFARDVNNITAYYGQFAPQLLQTRYAKEIWMLYEDGKLTPETALTGLFVETPHEVDMDSVIDEIIAAEDEFYERQRARKERDDE
ncbi:serine protein kinase RIO [Pectobacterium quasiaquaticum]|uniref:non-specific serine/threonine protein kinase n=1 Tax=Pectobacterium quasiaquaticum TaxID=2774015 RepID=A0A9Q2EP51_9GAMM|nr:PA4780 family RIO1-like protein kinase [Pectobacterium quasiaquaticum]MBE5203877.1 serine protein kinase RIO [Pectobacterium quasiaquaticum]MBE5209883.1 serine protein kinase RIO [Pectobacterium quasiaquaticum]MBE5222543.1 serine protein kinase RIO [Pectobacterium quasiaquaticum]URG50028.1 serine protein kinase RIO [Pectobacterium quasiaquaticum]URG53824.1 serine protein kinase RIO [Pectobacterium quasiaquaticum]